MDSDAEYRNALEEVELLMRLNPPPGSYHAVRLDVLSGLVEAYEKAHYPIDPPTPEEAAEFRAEQDTPDMVHSPPHYTSGEMECIDAIRRVLGEEGFLQFCQGTALKYRWRAGQKNDALEDIAKAEWYESWIRGLDPRPPENRSGQQNRPPARTTESP